MNITNAPRAVLRFQYRIVRFPLQLIEERVVARLDPETPARLFYERSLGLLDVAVGNALADRQLEKRGGALAERSHALRRAAQLDTEATQAKEQADAELKAKSDKVIKDQKDARAAKEREVEEARTAAEDRKRAAEQAAKTRAAAAKQKADQTAAQRKKSAEAAKRDAQARIRVSEKKAATAAKSKLDDAAARRSEAASKRAQANRVEKLADAEKRKRQSQRAN